MLTIASIVFLIAFIFPTLLIARQAKKGAPQKQKKAVFLSVIAFYTCYLIGVSIACLNGVFDATTLPPRIISVTTIPLLVFLLGIVFNTRIYKTILTNSKLADLVKLHIFRLIGSFFLLLMFLKLLPTPLGLIAGLGDLITAISSLFVARAITTQKSYAKALTITWNTFGLLDILVTSSTAMYLTKLSIETGSQGVEILASFPFCFIPAFAPATIIFLHVSIYRKLFSKKMQ